MNRCSFSFQGQKVGIWWIVKIGRCNTSLNWKGLLGDKGYAGDIGEEGNQGPKGDIGKQGPLGPIGEPGYRGVIGETGEIGVKGHYLSFTERMLIHLKFYSFRRSRTRWHRSVYKGIICSRHYCVLIQMVNEVQPVKRESKAIEDRLAHQELMVSL